MTVDLLIDHRRRLPHLDALNETQKDARFRPIALAALLQYGLEATGLKLLFHSDGVTYRVDAEDRSTYLLRIHTGVGTALCSAYCDRTAIESPLRWQLALSRETSLTVQCPVTTDAGDLICEVSIGGNEKYLCTLVTWVPGTERDEKSREQASELGSIVGVLHQHVVQWSPEGPLSRPKWDAAQTWGYFEELRPHAHEGGRVSPIIFELAQTACELAEELMKSPRSEDSWGLIHGELGWFGNSIFDESASGSPIDFNGCAYGYFMHDLAKTMWFVREDFREGLLAAYGARMPLPKNYLEQLSTFYFAEMMFRTGTRAQVNLELIMPDYFEDQLRAGLEGDHGFLFERPV